MGDIEQKVKIIKIDQQNITAEFISLAACDGCRAKDLCNKNNCIKSTVNIVDENAQSYSVGQEITVQMNEKDGLLSVIIAYLLPLIIFVISLLILTYITKDEIKSGIYSIIILITYYLLLISKNTYLKKKLIIKTKREI